MANNLVLLSIESFDLELLCVMIWSPVRACVVASELLREKAIALNLAINKLKYWLCVSLTVIGDTLRIGEGGGSKVKRST